MRKISDNRDELQTTTSFFSNDILTWSSSILVDTCTHIFRIEATRGSKHLSSIRLNALYGGKNINRENRNRNYLLPNFWMLKKIHSRMHSFNNAQNNSAIIQNFLIHQNISCLPFRYFFSFLVFSENVFDNTHVHSPRTN